VRTCRMLELGLEEGRCTLLQGEAFSLASLPLTPTSYMVYPGEGATDLRDLVLEGQEGEGEVTLVFLDGTWRQAGAMWRRSPSLHHLPRVRLGEVGPSEYVVRSQPIQGGLSTLEAAAHSLALLEGRPEVVGALLRPLRALCNLQIHHGRLGPSPATYREENLRYCKRKPQYPPSTGRSRPS